MAVQPGSRLQVVVSLALVAGTIIALYLKLLGGYLWDDDFGLIASGRTFDPSWAFAFASRSHFYRPLVDLYFDVAVWLLGYSPRAFHAANIGLHIVNAWLVFMIARRMLRSVNVACAAALFFAVLPGIVDAVAWVSAVTALLMTTCYLVAILTHLVWLETGRRSARAVTVVAFGAALLVHEGAVTLLPMLIVTDYLYGRGTRRAFGELARQYAGFALVLIGYLTVSFVVNRHNYVVTEGKYRIGLHALLNLLEYVSTLYVGRRGAAGLVTTVAALLAVTYFGTREARYGLAWMLLALVPYSFFVTGGAERYAYLAAAGFALLLAATVAALSRALRSHVGGTVGSSVSAAVAAFVAVRFFLFAFRGVSVSLSPGEPYRDWMESFRRTHPTLPAGAAVTIVDPHRRGIDARAFLPMLQLEYADPELRVDVLPAAEPSADR